MSVALRRPREEKPSAHTSATPSKTKNEAVPLKTKDEDTPLMTLGNPAEAWERACLTILGASITGPLYFLMYCFGWMKQHQGNGICLEMMITFYPVALSILLCQIIYDHDMDTWLGRRAATLLRFSVTAPLNVILLPVVWFYIDSKMSLWAIFCLLGFAHGAMLGSSFELCLQMPASSKGIQYLNVGMQVGGVAAGIFGVVSGFTLNEMKYPPAYQYFTFSIMTSTLCAAGLGSILLLHCRSKMYDQVMTTKPQPPPSSISEVLKLGWQLRVSVVATILTSGSTLLCNGFYTYAPTSAKSDPMQNATLVVLLVYANLCSDLIGRSLCTYLPCPSGADLLKLASLRQLFCIGFFLYISQTAWLSDIWLLVGLAVYMVAHGVVTTWSFVHANRCGGGPYASFVSKFCVITLFVAILIGSFLGELVEVLFFL